MGACRHERHGLYADIDASRVWLAVLLQHFSRLDDEGEPCRVIYPLPEVLLLVTCATIASCDDFDEIVTWASIIWIPCASFTLPFRHPRRTLAAGPRQPRRSGDVRLLL